MKHKIVIIYKKYRDLVPKLHYTINIKKEYVKSFDVVRYNKSREMNRVFRKALY